MPDKQATSGTLTEHEVGEIRALIEHRSGILFDASRERFFFGRLQEHMVAKKVGRGAELLRLLRNSNVEYDALLERLLTQETSFFRYPSVFEALEKRVLPELHMKKFWENPRTLRIWSAGCSSGEEPYSIAMTVADAFELAEAWNIHILATDVSRDALQHAERGVYSRRDVETLTPRQVESHFARVGDQFMVKPKIRNMVTFAPMNLAQVIYMGRFDCIFCMNVMIYFSEERRAQLIQRFYDYLEPGGYLFLGHAESVAKLPVKFESVVHKDSILYHKAPTGAVPRTSALASEKP
ncbi:MAG TPA: protein-glutamate O-methyltransferase CheR [Terriglobales bacterium]|jgi:chemotaxis protein methyltransferase CheR|nr:protein-glutamate O-methyltransferase CheR [Terriglobales bacterium]